MSSDEDPWFRDGLRFECTRCGNCCTGEPGVVWVDREEIAALAAAVGKSPEEFTQQHTRQVGRRRSLLEKDNGDCEFFDRQVGCTLYDQRPKQCRTWPFWDSNLKSPRTWRAIQSKCPGAGRGPLFTVHQIIAQSKIIKI